MNSSPSRRKPGPAIIVLGGLGLAYPFAIFLLMGRVPAGALVVGALVLACGRLVALRHSVAARALVRALIPVVVATAGLGLADAQAAALVYPALMSLGMAAAFGLSLLRPPSLVEILASLTEPAPSPAARAYMRVVSLVWCLFLIANAAVSALTMWLADLQLWTLYNGLISYLLMGALFAGEFAVRRRVRRREAAA
jgi:uncharacterized membrane protein